MSIFGSAAKKFGSERERNKSGCGRSYDCSQLGRKGFQSDNKYNQKCQRCCNRLVIPREKISCLITFMPRETDVLMRYNAKPGMAQRTTASAETISGWRCRRW